MGNETKASGAAEPKAVPVVDPPKPDFVTAEQLAGSTAATNDKITGLTNQIQNLTALAQTLANQGQRQAEPVRQAVAAPTDKELSDALVNGDVGAIRRMMAAERAATIEMIRGAVDPLQSVGMQAIGDLTKRVLKSEIPYYDTLKSEIDKQLEQLDPSLRMQPEAVIRVGQMVAGQNIDKIVKTEVERQLREARGNSDGALDGNGTHRETQTDATTTAVLQRFADVAGADAMKQLKGKGLTPDQFVKRLGYESVEKYLELAEAETN